MDKKDLIKVSVPVVGEEEIEAVAEVLRSGYYVQGRNVKRFEEGWAEYIGVEHAIATNSGTSALHIALAAADIGPGDEVIVPPLTFFATIEAVLHQNAIPVFADIDPETFTLDPVDVEEKITDKTKAIIPVHLFGLPAEMDEIMRIAEKNNLIVIEDCAQAHGAEYKGRRVGSIGDVGCWSFYATKNITTGEGGMITTNNPEIAKKARIIRSHGMTSRDDHIILGYNYRMNEIQAAIGIVQLRKIDELNDIRIRNSLYLIDSLRDIEWMKPQKIPGYVKHVFFWAPFLIDEGKLGIDTKELTKKLREKGVEVRHRYREPLYKQAMLLNKIAYPRGCPFTCPFYGREIDYSRVYLPNAEKVAGKLIGLPNHPKLGEEDLMRVVEVFRTLSASP